MSPDIEPAVLACILIAKRRGVLPYTECGLFDDLLEERPDRVSVMDPASDERAFREAVASELIRGDQIYHISTGVAETLNEAFGANPPPTVGGRVVHDPGRAARQAKNLEVFWSAVSYVSDALTKFILEGGHVTTKPTPVYRGLKEKPDPVDGDSTLTSVSTDEEVSYQFTANPDLRAQVPEHDGDILLGCCMMRIILEKGTPYLDAVSLLASSGGWNKSPGNKEYILPPGLVWKYSEESRWLREGFPDEKDFGQEETDGDPGFEAGYDTTYYSVSPR